MTNTTTTTTTSPYLLDCLAVVRNRQSDYYNLSHFEQVRTLTHPYPFTVHVHTTRDVVVSKALVTDGCFECSSFFSLMNALYSQPREKVFLLDLGGNIGQYSLGAAANRYEAVAFEPTRKNWGAFCHSVAANPHFDQLIRVYNVALYERMNASKLLLGARFFRNPSANYVVDGKVKGGIEGETFTWAVSVDMLVRDNHLSLTNKSSVVVKADVEGFECKALQGAMQLLSSLNVVFVLMESNPERLRECRNRQELFDLFRNNGLKPYIFHVHDSSWLPVDAKNWTNWTYNMVQDDAPNRNISNFDVAWSRNMPNSTDF